MFATHLKLARPMMQMISSRSRLCWASASCCLPNVSSILKESPRRLVLLHNQDMMPFTLRTAKFS